MCILFAVAIGLMIIFEFNPEYVEDLTISGKASKILVKDSNINIVLYDVNYLSWVNEENEKFTTEEALEEISDVMYNANPVVNGGADIALIHQVYYDSKEFSNQYRSLADKFNGLATYASNYDSFVDTNQKLGKINLGICSLSRFEFIAQRLWLPEIETFPDVVFSYKPGVIKQTMNIEGMEQKLVVFSSYLYSNNENQIKYIKEYILDECEAGNYVVFGGTFENSFKDIMNDIGDEFKVFTVSDDSRSGFVVSSNISTSSISVIDSSFGEPMKLTIKF